MTASPARWWVLAAATLAIVQGASWNVFAPVADTLKTAYPYMDDTFIRNVVNYANISFLLSLQPTALAINVSAFANSLFASSIMALSCLVRCIPGLDRLL